MKKILTVILFFVSLLANAQIDTSQIKFIEPPDSTAIGVPDGKLISKDIGAAGGTIVSEDGRIELIFPANALTANTTIGIQPTTNPAPNGTGKAYQFEPSGTQFKKPVEIIFHYTDDEAKVCAPDLMGFAMQDHTGKWSFFDYDNWDSTAKILKGTIEHFSGHAPHVSKFKLVPGKRTIMVDEETSISIADVFNKFKGDQKILPESIRWYVNGAEGGNSSVGTMGDMNIKTKSNSYKAPSLMPDPNPVTIRVLFFISSGKNKPKLYEGECGVEIYDGYEIKIDGKWTLTPAGRDDVALEITETSSVSLAIETTRSGTNWKLMDKIKNDPMDVKITKCPKDCTCRFNKNNSIGMIEIAGITDVKVSGKTATVLFEKANATFPTIDVSCDKHPSVDLLPKFLAVPSKIVFELKDGEQVRKFSLGDDLFPIEYTFTIKRKKN